MITEPKILDRVMGLVYDTIHSALIDNKITILSRDELVSYCKMNIVRSRVSKKKVKYYLNYNRMGQQTKVVCESNEQLNDEMEKIMKGAFKEAPVTNSLVKSKKKDDKV